MPKDDPVGLPELELPLDLLLLLLLLLLLEEPELLLLLPKAFMMLLLLSQDMVTEIIFVWMWDSVSLVFSRRDPDLNSCSERGIQDIYTCGPCRAESERLFCIHCMEFVSSLAS